MENLELSRKLIKTLLVDIFHYEFLGNEIADMYKKGDKLHITWQLYGNNQFYNCFNPLNNEKDIISLTEELLNRYEFKIYSPLTPHHPDGWYCLMTNNKKAETFHSTDPKLSLAICKTIFKAYGIEWIKE